MSARHPKGNDPLTFPLETEATIRRRIIDICQSHARNIVEITRELVQMVEAVVGGEQKTSRVHYSNIIRTMEDSNKLKMALLQEVASVGSLLLNREDFLRLIFRMTDIVDYEEAVCFRLGEVSEKRLKVERKYLEKIGDLLSMVLEEMGKVRDTLMCLALNPTKAIEMSKLVEETEKKIDASVRSLEVELLNSKLQVPSLLIIRDFVDRIESIADIGLDVVDHVRVLALTS